jgi:SAM-dependent methyltransferase
MSHRLGDPAYLAESELEDVASCPACAAAEGQREVTASEGTAQRGLVLSYCSRCGHHYLSRRPTRAWYATYYAEGWDTGRLEGPTLPSRLRQALKSWPVLRRAVAAVRTLRSGPFASERAYRTLSMFYGMAPLAEDLDALPRGAKVLEIGTGYGSTLDLLRAAGFSAVGTEANRHRVDVCRAQGLQVLQTGIDDLGPVAPLAPFDFIYSAHVFEHLLDLDRMMSGVAPLLAEGGGLCLEVPHGPVVEDLVNRVHQPGHCHLFSVGSLTALLSRHGFVVSRVLADVNLLVTAQMAGGFRFPSLSADGGPALLAPWRAALSRETTPVSYSYDHFHVVVRRESDGSVLFARESPYRVRPVHRPGSRDLVNTFVLQVEPESPAEEWPIRFLHPTAQPPIWMKHQ